MEIFSRNVVTLYQILQIALRTVCTDFECKVKLVRGVLAYGIQKLARFMRSSLPFMNPS